MPVPDFQDALYRSLVLSSRSARGESSRTPEQRRQRKTIERIEKLEPTDEKRPNDSFFFPPPISRFSHHDTENFFKSAS